MSFFFHWATALFGGVKLSIAISLECSQVDVIPLVWCIGENTNEPDRISGTQKTPVDRKFKQLLNMQHHEYLCFPVENMKISKCCTTEICYTQKWKKKWKKGQHRMLCNIQNALVVYFREPQRIPWCMLPINKTLKI